MLSAGVLNHPVSIHWKKWMRFLRKTAAKPLPSPTTNASMRRSLSSFILAADCFSSKIYFSRNATTGGVCITLCKIFYANIIKKRKRAATWAAPIIMFSLDYSSESSSPAKLPPSLSGNVSPSVPPSASTSASPNNPFSTSS